MGYFRNKKLTESTLVRHNDDENIWFATGDKGPRFVQRAL